MRLVTVASDLTVRLSPGLSVPEPRDDSSVNIHAPRIDILPPPSSRVRVTPHRASGKYQPFVLPPESEPVFSIRL